jgi:phospholipase/lecithinase/hemolysin
LLTAILLVSPTALARDFSNIVVFGDSTSDTGNLFRATKRRNPPSPKYFNGRFSNGPVWVEYVRSRLRIPVRVEAYGGAQSGYGSSAGGSRGMRRQVDSYLARHRRGVDSRTLVVMMVGANDANLMYKGMSEYTVSRRAATNIATAVAQIAAAGGRKFAVANMVDLGRTPFGRANNRISASKLSRFSRRFNWELQKAIRSTGQPVKIVDLYPLLRQIQSAPGKFGLSDARRSCLAVRCRSPRSFLFWDSHHLTTQGHRLLAELMISKF